MAHSPKEDVLSVEHVSERVTVSQEDDRRIVRRIDLVILPVLVWVYFLQILDKSVLGLAALFGLKEDTGLVGNQYSTLGSMSAIAQLVWQPFSSYLLVRVPPRILMPTIVFCWGASLCGMAASTNFASLAATRFLLGLFEAACLPLFAIITSVWYRRAEQPLRICIWYGTNGLATILGAALSFGLGHIRSDVLHSYQIIFLFTGLITVVTPVYIVWKLDNKVSEARFLSEDDRLKAVERVRANNTGTSATAGYKWRQATEAALEIKTWLFVAMALLLNIGASVSNVFGPLILQGLGFDRYMTSLLNMPFGAVQVIVIIASSYVASRWRNKSIMLCILVVPVIVGLALLYSLETGGSNTGPLLFGYYLIACLFGVNPLIVSWISANTAGSTKKSVVLSAYNAAVAAGNIIGPLLFQSRDAPRYQPGLRACIGIFVALFGCIVFQVANLMMLNKLKRDERVKNGKPAEVKDLSMERRYTAAVPAENEQVVKESKGDLDLTDKENDEFVYVY